MSTIQQSQPKGAPVIDPGRSTGRTTRQIQQCLLAAALGKRVMFVTAGPSLPAYQQAREMLKSAQSLGFRTGTDTIENGTTKVITFYRGGGEAGVLRFRSISDNPTSLNLGLSEHLKYLIVDDHYVQVKRDEESARLSKVAAMEQIALLMEKHGWEAAMPPPGQTSPVSHFYYGSSNQECDIRTIKPVPNDA